MTIFRKLPPKILFYLKLLFLLNVELEDGDHLEMKKEIEFLRSKYGEEGWLHGTSASAVQNLMNISTPPSKTPPFAEGVPISHIFNSESSASITNVSHLLYFFLGVKGV